MSRIVFAPDSFKGTVSATDAAAALARGWCTVRPGDDVVQRPMADGGEGTLDAFAAAVPGAVRMPVTVRGPVSEPVESSWLLLPGPHRTGVVELASTSGITLLDSLAPLDAHTAGFGEAIAAALDHGVQRLLLALGGSASTDGGAGALAALGAGLLDAAGRPIRLGSRGLGALAQVRLSTLRPLPRGGAVILGDVTNPLLGPAGAAAVFGPQKGATPAVVGALESNLARLAGLVPTVDPATPGAGAAGGAGFGLLAWGAQMGGGARVVAEAIGLPEAMEGAALVITGEGRFDGQSAAGKVPSEVARLARAAGVPVALAAGAIDADPEAAGFAASASLSVLAGSGAAAMSDAVQWLERAGAELARAA
ncbi:glycerate kinase [Agromyces sp. SYSU K20354]|uniref:glycerate kinase n=1 Tax=Agromyces cavernae TaxID=2898659 RepID=UPI001E5AA901|nr:glycerate kinase [Agromyces cavernae]MCD2442950.1 glycerate kinase [Agromyces cavernae]